MLDKTEAKTAPFRLEEATIDDLHAAIRSGATTVVAVVQHYLARVRAYNGVASALVTKDGAPVAEATGVLPLNYMLSVMRDTNADQKRRDAMTIAAAPYLHPKLSAIDAKLSGASETP